MNRVRMPVEALRPKFWEVSGNKYDGKYATPFQKERVLEQLADWEMAAKLCMQLEDYRAMEEGRVRPMPLDILNFCEIIDCHPLDLYAEPGNGVPLPQEVFQSLLIIMDHQGYDAAFMARTQERLDEEMRAAHAMVEAHRKELRPLLISLGYAPDMRSFNAPLYRLPEKKTGEDEKTAEKKTTLDRLMEQDAEQPRNFMESCLNAYELMLERSYAFHAEHLSALQSRSIKCQEKLREFAVALYGEQGAEIAIQHIAQWIATAPNHDELRSRFLQSPGALADLTDANYQALHNKGSSAAQDVERKARLFLSSALVKDRYDQKLNVEKIGELTRSAFRAWDGFKTWRHSLHTQRLLDWFENWMVLNSRSGSQNSRDIRAWRGPDSGLPFLPH